MNDKYFVDTNVLIYCYTVTEIDKKVKAQQAVNPIGRTISTQVLQEVANTLRRKFQKGWSEINAVLDEITGEFIVHQNSKTTISEVVKIANRYGYSFYDSLIIAAAIESSCSILYSEDLQTNQAIAKSLTIRSPF
ncbi:PIN domain-containing protein [Spirosoma aerolatum]|uniref:PIN domain-containing protein n=1 Tax=Spirosoma aerolatum TaxID=1211326 RepID=UPI0009AD4750|nr:PIN domain-containing protein [Spirosoma aerolatum]